MEGGGGESKRGRGRRCCDWVLRGEEWGLRKLQMR